MPRRINFSNHVLGIFEEENTTYEALKNLMFDLALGREIYDEESDRVVSKREANDKLLTITHKIFGINEHSTKRERQRAYRDHSREYFDVIEEVLDNLISTGLTENEFFETFVDYRNMALDDELQFWTENETILSVAKAGRTHHDHILQRLGVGEYITLPVARYVCAVGAAIDRYVLGKEDWAKMVGAVATAFKAQILEEICTQMTNAASKLPVQQGFVNTGALSSATKANFDEIIENVSIAAGNTGVVILGTQTALKKLNNLTDVDWRSASQKEAVASTGRLGSYEGTPMIEIPQRFVRNDVTQKIYDDTKIFIMPIEDNKFIKMVDAGETLIDEVMERGEVNGRYDDIQKYEVQRDFGIGVLIGRYFGQWTITADSTPSGGDEGNH